MTVTIIVTLAAKAGQEDAVGEILRELARRTRMEPGFLVYDIYKAQDRQWCVIESWADEQAHAEHARADHVKLAGARFADLLDAPPQVSFCTPFDIAQCR